MSHVVGFKVQRILKFFGPRLLLALGYDYRRMNVSVVPLGLTDDINYLIHLPIQLFVSCYRIHKRGSFKPLVEITIMPFWPPVSALFNIRGYTEVLKGVADLRIIEKSPHIRNHNPMAPLKLVSPKSVRPLHGVDIDAVQLDTGADRGIRYPSACPNGIAATKANSRYQQTES